MDMKLIEALDLAGTLSTRLIDGTTYLMIAIDSIPVPVVPPMSRVHPLGGTQRLMMNAIIVLAGITGITGAQTVYDKAIHEMPPPLTGDRDRRPQTMRRALATLHAKGHITLDGDIVKLNS